MLKDIYIQRRLNNEFYISGGGGSSAPAQAGSSEVVQREAPGVEARKLTLYDQAAKLAASPVTVPGIQVAPISAIEQAAITQAGQTG